MQRNHHRLKLRQRASALVVVLLFLVLLTGVTVVLLLRGGQAVRAANTDAGGNAAGHLAFAAFGRVLGELQAEVETAREQNLDRVLPVRFGEIDADPRVSTLVRRSLGDDAELATSFSAAGFSGVPFTNHAYGQAASVAPHSGPRFVKPRWNAPRLMSADKEFDGFGEPQWIYLTGEGPKKSPADAEAVEGRFSYILYDVGGLADVNELGYSDNVAELADKGSMVFADVGALMTALGAGTSGDFLSWKNPSAPVREGVRESYYGGAGGGDEAGWIERGDGAIPPGGNRMFSRAELIAAAAGGEGGMAPALLPSLRVGSKVGNRVGTQDLFAGGTATPVDLADPSLAATDDTDITIYRLDGTEETYTVAKDSPLPQSRFPLSRLRWFGERDTDGTPLRQDEIKRHFGLKWDAPTKMFVYTSPDSNTAATSIKTLVQLATQINGGGPLPAREPDFFEWLRSAINPNSLGQTGGQTYRDNADWETSKDLHLLRIGLNIIDQADPDSIPTGARSEFAGVTPAPFDSFGQENLPYLNEVIATASRNGSRLEGYLQFEMWNPNRNAPSHVPRDFAGNPLRNLRVGTAKGSIFMEPYTVCRRRAALETPNNASWQSYNKIAEESLDGLGASDFVVQPLAENFLSAPVSAGDFSEPYLFSASGPATNNPLSDPKRPERPALRIGDTPADGVNAILVATSPSDPPTLSGKSLADIYPEYITYDANGTITGAKWGPTTVSPTHNFFKPGGAKAFNGLTFYSDGSTLLGVATDPVDFLVEVEDSAGNRFPAHRYHNLAFGQHSDANFPHMIVSDEDETFEAGGGAGNNMFSRWVSDPTYDPGSCFANWQEYTIRRGYFMVDARTERFGLNEQMIATPGVGITNVAAAYSALALWQTPFNMVYSLFGTAGKADPEEVNSGPILHWSLQTAAQGIGVPAALAMNYSGNPYASDYYYTDFDNVPRRADAGWVDNAAHPALPLASFPNAAKARPVILDRPFRNVGELGVVFRDVPWKSLDLFSPDSGDRRLLDVFSIEDAEMVAGRLHPASAREEVVAALLGGVGIDPSGMNAASVLAAESNSVAGEFMTAANVGQAEQWMDHLAENTGANPATGSSRFKHEKESFARALSGVLDSRHWQLMLDLVVQSGRQPGGDVAFDPARFLVEGQRRYWITFAIDRFTGEVVSQHWEPVYE